MITKSVLIRGQPACIFCSAKDESEYPLWFEVVSRFLVALPNMVQQKYLESDLLIGQKAGLPKALQQEIIVSDRDVERAKECIIHIQDQMKSITSVWIPYHNILSYSLPDYKGTDNRATKRIFSLLRILPLVRSELRPILRYPASLSDDGNNSNQYERLVIASIQDLSDALKITHNSGSLPAFKMKFYRDIFCKCSNENGINESGARGDRVITISISGMFLILDQTTNVAMASQCASQAAVHGLQKPVSGSAPSSCSTSTAIHANPTTGYIIIAGSDGSSSASAAASKSGQSFAACFSGSCSSTSHSP